MYITTCKVCSDIFEVSDEKVGRGICYKCTLKDLCGNHAPEEGDFNSAMIISGEMTEQDAQLLQEDLRAAETGQSFRGLDFEEDEDPYSNQLLQKYKVGGK